MSEQLWRETVNEIKREIGKALKSSEYTVKSCGTKFFKLVDKYSLSKETGFWEEPSSVSSKPPRWIIHISKNNGEVSADFAKDQQGNLLVGAKTLGFINNSEGNCAAIIFRVIPAVKVKISEYVFPEWEWLMVMVFSRSLPPGTSGEIIKDFNNLKGTINYHEKIYKVKAFFICKTPTKSVNLQLKDGTTISYEEATKAFINFLRGGNESGVMLIKEFDPSQNALGEMVQEIKNLLTREMEERRIPEIEPKTDLYGINPNVYKQINAAIKAGKRHIIFYGPPGTGKTTLAQYVASELSSSGEYQMLTASSSWTSQELIGGYQPIGNGKIGFVPGVILRNFDRPVIIDELNRCPIDKVMGPLFSVLSGQATTLPYKATLDEKDSPFHVIYPNVKEDAEEYEWYPDNEWRLIATINTIDKTQLGQLSYALSRRFAWIKIGVPEDLDGFTRIFMEREGDPSPFNPISDLWLAVNEIRPIGGAPIIDLIRSIREMDPTLDLLVEPDTEYLELLFLGLTMFILPLLDGISRRECEHFINILTDKWKLNDLLKKRLENEMGDIIA